jgi:DNA-directed RNA polymerase beta' subunit
MALKKDIKTKTNFSKISIGLASPEEILELSSGEVLKPETINYRTYKPERDGLFCERIFGPVKDYECHCGKYKRIRYKGIVCDRCGVEVTEKKVRRERMGHIQLVVPVVHIWYFRSLPNKIGYLLGLPTKKLDSVIYHERYIVIQPGILEEEEGVKVNDLLSEEEYLALIDKLPRENQMLEDSDPQKFIAKMGADAVHDLLSRLDLDALSFDLRHRADTDTSMQRKNDALKRLQVVEAFRAARHRNKPEWMVIKIVPVIPPELRPLVPLDGGRFATSDLNDLYRRVIIRNNRLKRLIEIKAPEVILRNEKRMLQEAVDSLFDNSRKSSAIKTDSNRPLKSLSDSLKGKQGRFRQNLLGKRVDYSARSVIVVGPELKMHECGLPKDMAAELYKPFIIRKLIERGIVKTVKAAKKFVDRKDPVVWDILEHVMKGHPVLLNRAPTLHRLGIQAFQPKMIEGKAIQLHPLACTAFNADFDGDQMAVHLPLGNEAIAEAQLLMLSSHNILNPANGAPITVPSQDMVLGLYYMTKERIGAQGEGLTFYSPEEAKIAYNEKKVSLHAVVKVRIEGELIQTTIGRILVNEYVPEEVGFVNTVLSKKELRNVIGKVIASCGVARTAQFLDDIKDLGYSMAFQGGLSFNLDDVIVPDEKTELIQGGYEEVEAIMEEWRQGFITPNERYNKIIDVWTIVNNKLSNILIKQLAEDDQGFNSVHMMMDSGARGSKEQIRQLSGMRGLMNKPQKFGAEGGQIIENPILANFKEGLSVLEYFISTHGARKSLSDTALKTADAGGVAKSENVENKLVAPYDALVEIDELRVVPSFEDKNVRIVVGRYAEIHLIDPVTNMVTTHNLSYGSRLYVDPGDMVKQGDLICEWDVYNAVIICEQSGKIEFESIEEGVTYQTYMDETTKIKDKIIIESKDRSHVPTIHIMDDKGQRLYSYNLPVGAHLLKESGDRIEAGQVLVKIPRAIPKSGDITGGLPRVTELFEARNPSNPAVVSEIDGDVIELGRIKRSNREIVIQSKTGEIKKYLVPLSKQVLVQLNDFVRAGTPLSEGSITPADILAIKGPTAVQEYIVNEVKNVYRMQEVKINDKHFEVIVRQMMRKVEIVDAGDTHFLEQQEVDKNEFMEENDRIWGKKVVLDPGDSATLKAGMIVTARKLRDENSSLKRRDLRLVEVRDAIPATSNQILQGITRAALQTSSFMSAASFQETTKVLNEAAIQAKVDRLEGMKENVITGNLIPAGTGQREFEKLIVGSREEFERIEATRDSLTQDVVVEEAEHE